MNTFQNIRPGSIPIYPTFSQLPGSAQVGTTAVTADTLLIYIWTGSVWELYSSGAGGPPTGPAGGDLGGTYPNPTVLSVAHVTTGVLGVLNGGTGVTTSTGTGSVVLSNSPSLVSPALDTPTALIGTNITGTGSGFTAGNINATSNSTLTTLSALSLPFSQVTGTVPISQGGTNNTAAYTSGSVIFSNGTSLTQDNANFFWNDTNFSLGIGMNTPASNAFIDGVNSSGATKRIQLTGYGNTIGYRGRYANGTVGSPTAAVNTNVLAFLSAQGYGATGFPAASTALINMTAAGTFTDSSMPTDVNILTTPVGSVTAVQTALFSHTGATTLGPTSSTAIHQFNGGVNYTTKTITANYTVDTTTTDMYVYCNAAGAITVTLPAPTTGRRLIIKDISGAATTNNITIARHASENIEGLAASYVIQVSYEAVILTSDGTNWWIDG